MSARLLRSGALDPTYGRSGAVTISMGAGAVCDAAALQPDGRVVLTGVALSPLGATSVATVRLLRNGGFDPSFGSKGIAMQPGAGVNAVALQGDGRIVIAGVGATAVRLLSDGAPDLSFGGRGATIYSAGGVDAAANGVAIQHDGKIVLAGIDTVNGRPELAVIRLMG
jgi:uncharacterized delta-60 repeat protein